MMATFTSNAQSIIKSPTIAPTQGLTPCVYGQDLGSHASEGTLAYEHAVTGANTIIRVPLFGDGNHRERIYQAESIPQFKFLAYAAVEGEQFIVGKMAFGHDICIPLKTILVYASGIHKTNVLARLPGGKELLVAIGNGVITVEKMEAALLEHFLELKRNVMEQAQEKDLVVKDIVLSYPHYLYQKGSQEHMEHYQKCYTHLMHSIWDKDIKINFVKEGFALSLYLSEPFEEGTSFLLRKRLSELYSTMIRSNTLNLMIIDMGGSSVNIQMISLYYDVDGNFKCSQANDNPDWAEGTQGGSDLTNSRIKEVAKAELGPDVSPGVLAAIINEFETKKYELDFALDSSSEKIRFRGKEKSRIRLKGKDDPKYWVNIPASTVQRIFKGVFGPGREVWNAEIKRQLGIQKPFVVLFCGGSFASNILREQTKKDMDKYKMQAAKEQTVFEYAFLQQFDHQSASAVASGSAISMLRVPPAREVINGSALLIQELYLSKRKSINLKGKNFANVLFHKGHAGRAREFDYLDHTRRASLLRGFRLICDPNYHKSIRDNGNAPDVVPVPPGIDTWNGAMGLYDLGFEVVGQDLPPGKIRFIIEGRYLDELARTDVKATEDPIKLILTCHKLSKEGDKVVRHPRSKRWILTLRTHPECKLLNVNWDEVTRCPLWCSICDNEITLAGYVCQDCSTNTDMCVDCYFPADSHWNEELQRPHEVCLVDMDV